MEVVFGPFLLGCAGFALGLWSLSSESRRLGFAAPRAVRQPSSSDVKRQMSRTIIAGLAGVALAVVVPSARTAVLAVALAAVARKTLTQARRRKRVAEMRREWPFLIESMAVAALSGMETAAAFQAAAKRAGATLREEVDKVTLRMMGGASLSRALTVVDEACLPDVKRLRNILARNEILGTPVAGMLKALSDEGYDAERQSMQERFNTLPLRLTAITVFFLLPPVLAVSVIPHVLTFLGASW